MPGGCDIAFRFQMLFFGAECLEFWPPMKYGYKRDSKTYHKMWHFLLRGCLCMIYTKEIIPMVTMGVFSGLFEEKTGTGNKWQVNMKG